MRICLCKKWGPPSSLVIEDGLQIGSVGAGEVAIAVHACGVNFPDLLLIQGKYQHKPQLPFAPGGEVAGIVTDVGEGCKRFKVGDRVMALPSIGGFSTDVIVKEEYVSPLPTGMDFVTASSFILAYGTADYAFRVRAKLKKEDLVLILGASGGVGLAAIQLAKAAGATVIAAASSEEKLHTCQRAGADMILNYRASRPSEDYGQHGNETDWRKRLQSLTSGRGIDIVLDNVGGRDCEVALRSMAIGGRYLVVGFASGKIPNPPLNLVLLKEVTVIGVFWGAWRHRDAKGSADQLQHLLRLHRKGLLRPVISRVYSLDDAPRALEDVGSRRVVGKIVIATRSGGGQDLLHSSPSISEPRQGAGASPPRGRL